MEKYIKIALISIIRQTFQNFEIILVNDDSNDNTINIINEFQSRDNRIHIINHVKNFGVYESRRDAILNSKGNYILLLDPDDMLLNKELFQKLYNYNADLNLDIIEFLVYHRLDNEKKLIIPKNYQLIHAHNFQKKIIYQPELSEILFKKPNSNKYSSIICRPIWNKLIRKEIILKSIEYVDSFFHDKFMIVADDTPINIMSFNFAKNYSNIKIPGYLYNKRENSMSRGLKTNFYIVRDYNFLLYYKFLYTYMKEYNKDMNYFYFELKHFCRFLYNIKYSKNRKYIKETILFFKNIKLKEKNTTKLKKYIKKFIKKFTNITDK